MTFSLRARHSGRTSWLQQGDAIALEFEDGKGVSGRIADVDVAPGGSAFTIICTHDGQPVLDDPPTGTITSDVITSGPITISHPHTSPHDRGELDGTQLPIPGLVDLDTGIVLGADISTNEVEAWKKAHGRVREILEVEREAHRKVTDELNAHISKLSAALRSRDESSRSRTTVQAGAVTITVEEN